ncbi:hypothetical protein NXW11_24630 [Bacteroides thetaiotaomicron]|nr:hypothetical protein [Bacteroides thetaiotaomicron]MCS2621075.1 hypothetical protein [Bacteroides thetaiotaomicron]
MYQFDYPKYLFIVIPGSIAGSSMEWMKGEKIPNSQLHRNS